MSDTPANGYGPNSDPGDTLFNDFIRGESVSAIVLADARGERTSRDPGRLTMTDGASPLPFSNLVVIERPPRADGIDALVNEIRAFYAGFPGGPALIKSLFPLPDLEPNGCEEALVLGYPAPMLQPFRSGCFLPSGSLDAPGWHHFVGYTGGRAVAAGSAYADDHVLRVENIAVMDDARGRGFGAAITAATVGVDLSVAAALIASDLGRPIYERLGFRALHRATYWLVPR